MDNPKAPDSVPTADESESAYNAPARPPVPLEQFDVDDSEITSAYANFCRLSGSPEELLIDIGLNPQPTGITAQPIRCTQRIVLGWYSAKRLFHVLQLAIERHEAAFGVLETDVHKRIRRK